MIIGKIFDKEIILKKNPNTVKPIINKIIIAIVRTNLYIDIGNLVSSLFLDGINVSNNINPQIPVDITHKLEKYSFGIILYFFSKVSENILITAVSPVGSAFETIFCKKLPLKKEYQLLLHLSNSIE